VKEQARFDNGGILTAASGHSETLELLINAGASRHNQVDKDLALGAAARAGSVEAVRDLIAYGANPNGDLSYTLKTTTGLGIIYRGYGAASMLTYAAESGNPQVVREILRYKPRLEAKDQQGQTALFAASQYRSTDRDGARAEIVSLLVNAGADVNARDSYSNTPLHETFLTDVAEELLKLGADVNARNLNGETPIFTTVNDHAIPLFIRYGADLSIRNKAGQTVLEAARAKGSSRQAALSKAIRESRRLK
jgi:ankyrin repeat protein